MIMPDEFGIERAICDDFAHLAGVAAQLHAECKTYKGALAFIVQHECFVYVKTSMRECFAVMPSGVTLLISPMCVRDWHKGFNSRYY